MSDAGFHNFPITLNPTAKEFRPTFLPPPNPNYYTFPLPPTPPPPSGYILPPPPPALPPPSTVPTRALLLSSVPTHVSESTLRRELEVFGDVRAVQMERLRYGIVTVHFYDIRQAVEALTEIKEQHMKQQCRLRKYFEDGFIFNNYYNNYVPPVPLAPPERGIISGRAVWAQFTFPVACGFPDGYNQGNVVVFNLGSDVSTAVIREIFEAFGCVKEIRDTPLKKNQKFVEFYDTRDAAKAVAEVNSREIGGKPVVVEFSRLGGHKYNHKQNKITPIGTGSFQPPPVTPYRSKPPCRKDRVVDYGGGREVIVVSSPRGGLKKNGKNFYKHQQSLEREAKWLSGGDCDGNGGRNKTWKGSKYAREKCDVRFLIKEDDVISSVRDSRTTVMIKNIPNKYSQKLLLNMLDNHCIQFNEQVEDVEDDQPLSSYDFVYLPIDFVNKCNVGYGFVNMTSPEATWRLYKAFHNKNWEVFNSKKICEVSYARLQGVEALKEHFKSSKFPREAEEYMPVVFTPPRDGRTLTHPTPIMGRSSSNGTTITSSTSSSISTSSEVDVGCHDDDEDVTDSSRYCNNDNLLVGRYTTSTRALAYGGDRNEENGGEVVIDL